MPNDVPDYAIVATAPDMVLSGSPMAYGTGLTSVTFTVPTGVHILSIVLPGASSISVIQVIGSTTGVVYFNEYPVHNTYQMQYYVLVPSGADTSVSVQITATAAGTAYVTGVTDTVAVASLAQNPAPWQAPNRAPSAFFFANPGQNNTVQLLGAPGTGKSIWLHSLQFMWQSVDANMSGVFRDSSPAQVLSTSTVTAGLSYYIDFKGARLTPNTSFQFEQTGTTAASTVNCRGAFTYSVY